MKFNPQPDQILVSVEFFIYGDMLLILMISRLDWWLTLTFKETNKQIFQSKFDDEFEFDEQKEIASYTISQMDIEKWKFVKKLIFTLIWCEEKRRDIFLKKKKKKRREVTSLKFASVSEFLYTFLIYLDCKTVDF